MDEVCVLCIRRSVLEAGVKESLDLVVVSEMDFYLSGERFKVAEEEGFYVISV